ncbi:MAG: hypothetical protein A2X36_02970 [Elusimicrobia bacterium GWA2_69_24]|nr:MAG: hypothetical protein A2X36_02970 [Elusimicrobia bacterium GWA2_69_24]HBL17718.1 hypothetical protein [Elusimicrobiota bacterium]
MLLSLPLAALLALPAAAEGFILFSTGATANYELGADRKAVLRSTAPAAEPEEHLSCGGRVLRLSPLFNTVSLLDAELREGKTLQVAKEGFSWFLGSDRRLVFVLTDNIVTALDCDLAVKGRAGLKPRMLGEITPQVSPVHTLLFEQSLYLLSNTGDLFVVDWTDPKAPKSKRVPMETAHSRLRGHWIDPEQRTLNVLLATREETPPTDLGMGTRVTLREVVATFDLRDPDRAPETIAIYEERELHQPVDRDPSDDRRAAEPDGLIYERMSPVTREGDPKGYYIQDLSRTTPAFAHVMVFDGKTSGLSAPRELAVLRGRGMKEPVEVFKDDGGAHWFKREGAIHFVGNRREDGPLPIYPQSFQQVKDAPAAREWGTVALPY